MATESDSPNTGALSTIIVVGALAMVAIVAAITALVRSTEGEQRNKVNSTANLQVYRELAASQRAQLTAPPGWVNRDKGLVSIPIQRAETELIKNIRANPYAATPVIVDAGAATDAAGATANAGAAADAGAATNAEAGATVSADAGTKTQTPAPEKTGATPTPKKKPAKATGATGGAAPTGSAKAPATGQTP
jgi:hypothetical protein